MTAYNDLNTGRVKIQVTGHTVKHTTLGRFVAGGDIVQVREVEAAIAAVYTLMETVLPSDFACLSVSWAPAGQANYITITPDPVWATITGTVTPHRRDAAKNWKVSGNDAGGNTTSITFWYVDEPAEADTSDDYRRTAAEGSIVTDIVNALTSAALVLVGRSGQLLSFKNYLNMAVSAYWQRELRK